MFPVQGVTGLMLLCQCEPSQIRFADFWPEDVTT